MLAETINGARINYRIVERRQGGCGGMVIALSPGGRSPMSQMETLAQTMAGLGWRVLLHDRRNCGASDVGFDATRSEYEMWADDLDTLLGRLDMRPAIVAGSSSGARLALTVALRHPEAVRALLLMRITGGRHAVERLIEKYYDVHSRAAAAGGMAAVCETEHFAEVIAARPNNRSLLMAMKPADFIACMNAWRAHFIAGLDLPLIGTSAADLGSLAVPVCVVPGNDLTHPRSRGAMVAPLIRDCEVHQITDIERDMDVTPAEEWGQHYPAMARVFDDFLRRKAVGNAVRER